MKTKRPAKLIATAEKNITIIRENAPVITLTGVAFGASYGHIAKLCGDYGPHGWVQYATAACVDLLCIIGAEERQRDKRIGRERKWGFVSWPTLVLVAGILVTLAANIATAEPHVFGYCVAAWPAGALLLAVSVLERRTSHAAVPAAASTEAVPRKRAQGSGTGTAAAAAAGTAEAVPAPVVPPPVPAAEPAASTAEPGERSDEELLREARAYRDELAAKGERVSKEKMRLRFTIGSSKALELARVLREDDQDDTREAVV
jgi:uncharacterized membrane protein (UPF0136 family)